ncbi:16878_t:CDS:2 [Dentiscutata erythropus]|uniref:16878_t:CDS:1 n=1 Tax=Dentiscutata erythropus TaxID=1348616 RepID=A0A9N9J8T8_9GLOM|nr:16878_t:CDS:2 [Dentiscutata erythropus]
MPYYCLVSNSWSNINKSSIINYMITTPDLIFYKSVCTKDEHHTTENIARGIDNIIQKAGIDKFVSIITDNTNNMKATWNILKNKYLNKVFLGSFEYLNHVLRTQATIYAIVANNSVEINENIKLERDKPYLPLVYKILQEVKNKSMTNLQVLIELCKNTLQVTRNH